MSEHTAQQHTSYVQSLTEYNNERCYHQPIVVTLLIVETCVGRSFPLKKKKEFQITNGVFLFKFAVVSLKQILSNIHLEMQTSEEGNSRKPTGGKCYVSP